MKTLNVSKLIKYFVLGTALVAGLSACGKRGDDNEGLNAFSASNNDRDINGQPFFETTTRAYSVQNWNQSQSLTISWRFAGQNINPNAPQQQNNNGQFQQPINYYSPAMTYVGKVAAIGRIDVSVPMNLYFCGTLPAGSYELQTQDVGRWNQGQISGIRLVARGAVTFTALLVNSRAWDNSNYYNGPSASANRYIEGTFRIEQINGYYCQGADFNMYAPWGGGWGNGWNGGGFGGGFNFNGGFRF